MIEPIQASLRVAIIEDDEIDRRAFKRAFDKAPIPSQVRTWSNGEAWLDDWRKKSTCAPDLFLLDINLPGMNGHQFLTELRQLDGIRSVPVIVMSTSSDVRDLDRAYGQEVAGYFVKPMESAHFDHVIATIANYWYLAERQTSSHLSVGTGTITAAERRNPG